MSYKYKNNYGIGNNKMIKKVIIYRKNILEKHMAKSKKHNRIDEDNIIQINRKKCIGCTACAFTCSQETKISVLKRLDSGRKTVEPKQGTFADTGCINCGKCVAACPTGAMNIRNDIELVKEALNSGKYLVLISSPVVKVTLGEEFNLPIGTYVQGKITPSAKKLGFQNVFNTEFGADMTVVEEANEIIKKIANQEKLPLFSSFCPAWIEYAEMFNPDILESISTSKSPQQMMGASIKTFFANTYNISRANIFIVSINSCAAKKYEAGREAMGRDNYKDIDVVLTVKEYSDLLKEKEIDITAIPDESENSFMSEYTGAGVLFGTSGGAMKSVIRTAARYLGSDPFEIDNIEFSKVCGYEYIEEGNITLASKKYKVAVINGLKEINKFISTEKWKEYLYIEVTACNEGCVGACRTSRIEKKSHVDENLCIGCGTCIENCPANAREFNEKGRAEINKEKCVGCNLCSNICRAKAIDIRYYDKISNILLEKDYIIARKNALISIDKKSTERISAENKKLQNIYKIYMGNPGSMKAIDLLHTGYFDKSNKIKNDAIKKRKSTKIKR